MSKTSSKISSKPASFANEAEEVDWLLSPAGRRHSERTMQQAFKAGIIRTQKRASQPNLRSEAKRTGKMIMYQNGRAVQPSDPAILEELMGGAAAKRTQAVSLRIPVGDVEAAKRIAAQTGLGYQTVLKEIIHRGLTGL